MRAASLLVLVLAAVRIVALIHDREQNTVPIRGSENLNLNCPSIKYKFPPGTLQCEACRSVAAAITHRIVDARLDLVDILDGAACDWLRNNAVLKHRKSGLRYFDNVASTRYVGDPWRGIQRNAVVGTEPYDETSVTYHTAEERRTLPCAHYFLQQHCTRDVEAFEEKIAECHETYTASDSRSKADVLFGCLDRAMCQRLNGPCDDRLIEPIQKEELVRFMKYQGAYGPQNFPYVAIPHNENKMQRNPYARGGEKAAENELFREATGEDL